MPRTWTGAMALSSMLWLSSFSGVAMSGEWRAAANLSVREIYTDNVGLNASKSSELISTVSPQFSLHGQGGRLSADVVGSLEWNDLNTRSDNFNPRIRGNANAELLDELLFVDATIVANQTVIDSFATFGEDGLNTTGNTTTTYNYSVSPYLVSKFRQFATTELRYTFDSQINSGNEIDDSDRHALLFKLESGPDFGIINWGLVGQYRKTEFAESTTLGPNQERADSEFISTRLTAGYRLDRKWQVTSSVGREWNDFVSVRADSDDYTWDLGLTWTPTRRTKIDIGYGDRFFGNTPTFAVEHKSKKTVLKASYSRILTDTRSLRVAESLLLEEDAFGRGIDPFGENTLPDFVNLTSNTNSTLVNENFTASISLKGRRTNVTATVNQSKQLRQDIGGDSKFSSYRVNADRNLSRKLRLIANFTWREQDNETSQKSDGWRAMAGLSRELGADSNMSLNYEYSERESDRTNDDFRQTRISLTFRLAL